MDFVTQEFVEAAEPTGPGRFGTALHGSGQRKAANYSVADQFVTVGLDSRQTERVIENSDPLKWQVLILDTRKFGT